MSEKLVNSTPTVSTLVIDNQLQQQQQYYSISDIIYLAFETGLFFAIVFLLTLAIKKFRKFTHGFAVSRDPSLECIDENSCGEHSVEIHDDSPKSYRA